MERQAAEKLLEGVLDALAAIEHERWSHWQRFMHDQAVMQPDGSMILPAQLVKKWEKQIQTVFADLSEKEKDSDREQVKKYLPVIVEAISDR